MSLTISDPSTYTVPEGQALLFSAVEDNETVYKYKQRNGSINSTTISIIKALDVNPGDLPCLVYYADLQKLQNENFVSVGEMAIAIATKASVKYVKQIADQKVSKATFLSTIAEMPTTAEMEQALDLKANASAVATDLSGKANVADVYTQAETVALLESFIGAHTVADITTLDSLEPGVYRFVWVLDPSDDNAVVDKNSPALYRWRDAHDDIAAGYEFLQSATSGAFAGTIQEVLDILGSGFDSSHTVATAIAAKANASDLSTLTGRVTDAEETISEHTTAIAGKASASDLSTLAGRVSDAETAIGGKAAASDLSTHTGNSNIHVTVEDKAAWSGKQNAITGTSGQFVKIGSDGKPVAVTVDMSAFGSVKSVNNESPDANGNISVTIPSDLSQLADSNGTIAALQSMAHEHVLDVENEPSSNYSFIHKFFGCGEKAPYIALAEIPISAGGISMDDFAQSENLVIKAFTLGYTVIGDGNILYTPSNTYNGVFTDITGSLTNVTDAAISGTNVIAALSGNTLYVRAAQPASNTTTNAIPTSGNLRGETSTLSKTEWAAIPGSFTAIESHGDHWLAIGVNGELYTAGSNKFHMQNGNDVSALVNSLTEITIPGLASGETIVKAATGRNFSLAMSEYNNGANHKIYAWGRQINGELGDGVSFLHDSDELMYRAFENGGNTVFVVMKAVSGEDADPFTSGAKTLPAGTEVFSFVNNHVNLVGVTDASVTGLTSNGATIVVGGVTYTRVLSSDFSGFALGSATPAAIKIPTLVYAYKSSDGAIVYSSKDTPAKKDNVYSDSALTTALTGQVTEGGFGYLVHGGKTYNRSFYDDVVTSESVCDNWFKMSAGYYHSGALRKNAKNETEVYLWGSNEYGQLGTGYYKLDSLTISKLTGSSAASVEIISRPMKLPKSLFPYTDVVDIQCMHYGTFLTRSNGKIYFAGCNKRNYLGTGVLSEEIAFIPKFIELSTAFTNNRVYAETYGSIVIHDLPILKEGADPVVKTVFKELTTEKLDNAISAAHNHAVDPGLIDSVTIAAAQFVDQMPTLISESHVHANQSSLNAISIEGNLLKINGVPYIAGGSGGTGIVVDESNVQLDTLGDVAGLCNLSGGFGLEVISYRRLHATDDSQGAIIQVAPKGALHNPYGRYVDLYNSSKTQLSDLSAKNQSKGLYGVQKNANGTVVGTPSFIHCTKDLVTLIEAVVKAQAGSVVLYYVDPAHVSNPTSGTVYKTITCNTSSQSSINSFVSTYGTLYWRPDTGATVPPPLVDNFYTTDKLESVGLGDYTNEESAFFDVYLAGASTPIIAASAFESNTYYFEDGTEITSVAQIVIPYDIENGEDIFHDVYDNDSHTGTPVITAAQVKAGLYKLDGTNLVRVRSYMIPEKFDENLFTGNIYIHPGLTNYSGVANQKYTYDTSSSSLGFYTETVSNVTTLKKVVIKLDKAVKDNPANTQAFEPDPGSMFNPMFAVVHSPNNFSASSVTGEYNAAVGFNSEAGGNENTVFGDYSVAKGLSNFVSGDMSFAQGDSNVVTGAQSKAYGTGNLVAGTQNIAVGCGNLLHGYYGMAVGDGNQVFGLYGLAVGSKNSIYTTMNGAITVGDQNVAREKAKDSVIIGKELDVYSESATVIGQKAVVERFTGTFPGEDYDDYKSVYATSISTWVDTLHYDEYWTSNKEGLFFGAGMKENRTLTTVFPLSFTKYRVRPNIAGFFSLSTSGNTRNTAVDPYLFEPFMQWNFVGTIRMNFTDPKQNENDVTKYTFEKRDGGRLKSFDPGITFNATEASTVILDFEKATRWKIKGTATTTPVPMNFVDGAEAYIVVYPGANISWTAFTRQTVAGQNVFSSIKWSTGTEIVSNNTSSGLALLKLYVVDDGNDGNVCIIDVIHNSLV